MSKTSEIDKNDRKLYTAIFVILNNYYAAEQNFAKVQKSYDPENKETGVRAVLDKLKEKPDGVLKDLILKTYNYIDKNNTAMTIDKSRKKSNEFGIVKDLLDGLKNAGIEYSSDLIKDIMKAIPEENKKQRENLQKVWLAGQLDSAPNPYPTLPYNNKSKGTSRISVV